MASGKLGAAALTANTNVTLYVVPADTVTTLNISAVNRGSGPAVVQLALAPTAVPANADWIEFNAIVPANGGILERTAIVAGPGERVIARSSNGDTTIRVHGFEEGL